MKKLSREILLSSIKHFFTARNSMIEDESSQDFVLDLLDEILDCTAQVIHNKYIQSQLQPYSVHAAKDLLLQIIEVKFDSTPP